MNVIEPAETECALPFVFGAKKNRTFQVFLDYLKLNAITVRDSYRLPKMDEFFDSFEDAQVISTLNFNSGYWKINGDKAEQKRPL